VSGRCSDVGDLPELGELPRGLEGAGALLRHEDPFARGERIKGGTQRPREAPGVEDDERPRLAGRASTGEAEGGA